MFSTYMSLKNHEFKPKYSESKSVDFQLCFHYFYISKIMLNFLIKKKGENYISYKYTIQYLFKI